MSARMGQTHVIFGTGPVGLALVDQLVERGHQVRVVNRSGTAPVPAQVEQMAGDAVDPDFALDAASGAGVVYQVLNPPYHRWPEEFPPLQRGVMSAAQAAGARLVSFENLYMYGKHGRTHHRREHTDEAAHPQGNCEIGDGRGARRAQRQG